MDSREVDLSGSVSSDIKGLQAGSLLRLPGAKPLSQMLLGACWCTIACVPSHCAQRHDAVLVLRLWLLPRPGCKEGAGGTLPPAVLVRAFVSGRVVRAVMRVWAGSQPLRDLSPCRLWFRTIWKFAFPWDEAVRSTKSPLKPLRTSYFVQPKNNSRGGPKTSATDHQLDRQAAD